MDIISVGEYNRQFSRIGHFIREPRVHFRGPSLSIRLRGIMDYYLRKIDNEHDAEFRRGSLYPPYLIMAVEPDARHEMGENWIDMSMDRFVRHPDIRSAFLMRYGNIGTNGIDGVEYFRATLADDDTDWRRRVSIYLNRGFPVPHEQTPDVWLIRWPVSGISFTLPIRMSGDYGTVVMNAAAAEEMIYSPARNRNMSPREALYRSLMGNEGYDGVIDSL